MWLWLFLSGGFWGPLVHEVCDGGGRSDSDVGRVTHGLLWWRVSLVFGWLCAGFCVCTAVCGVRAWVGRMGVCVVLELLRVSVIGCVGSGSCCPVVW